VGKTIVGITLFMMFMLTVFSWILGSSLTGAALDEGVQGYHIINGTKYLFETQEVDILFFIDPVLGAISIFVIIAIIVGVLGINILGSGLSSESVRIISAVVIYGGLWTIMSILAIPLIISIEYFGGIIYVVLTVGYVYGVVDSIYRGGG